MAHPRLSELKWLIAGWVCTATISLPTPMDQLSKVEFTVDDVYFKHYLNWIQPKLLGVFKSMLQSSNYVPIHYPGYTMFFP